ncbi:hypothetical protein HK099_007065 [Clydaea vesicula]|uniref:Peptidase M43 pregnancy-associated plasma-A domain-containing protein n=1 Tax=Clydaea vesicula TaxID=447962 RepID=A0AAD5TXC9_9FUNG|nr:hypothetical protein HK099_007065 [Clydaea vesicula]KAJ3384789.1 hypothetical protein HDU92_003428 [Lobulomyces angularis]
MKFLVIFSALILAATSFTTTNWCLTRPYDPELDQEVSLQAKLSSNSARPYVTIPTHFHIITGFDGPEVVGDISDKVISKQLKVINNAFSKAGFKFSLASTDRTSNTGWFYHIYGTPQDRPVKTALKKGNSEHLNIYISSPPGGILGYSSYPQDYEADPIMDGIILHTEAIVEGKFENYNLGDILVHQVGHWLGLFHTFEGGCNAFDGDFVFDTPAEASPSFACSKKRDTCTGSAEFNGRDPVTNYMDLSDDSCRNTFSYGQTIRMKNMYNAYRKVAPT